MNRLLVLALACVALAASVSGVAYGQIDNQTRFFIVTELGNTFEISGPPPDRLPGFDSAPYLNAHRIDTAYSLSAGGAPGLPPMAQFGQAGSVTALPEHDPRRPNMRMMLVTDWGSSSQYLFTPFPVGELRMDGSMPYLGPGIAADGSVDILEWCNGNGTGVSCVNNRNGRDLRATHTSDHGHALDLPAAGRSIIHLANVSSIPGNHLEVFFTCPDCRAQAKAYYGVTSTAFMERGFQHSSGAVPSISSPVTFGPGGLRGLAWDSVTDPAGITYWQDGGPCSPALSISGTTITGACAAPPGGPIQAGTANAPVWQPLTPGWNSVVKSGGAFVVVTDPGDGAKLQMRNGTDRCCSGFDGGVVNRAGSAAVMHDTDRHLLIMPNGGEVPADHPALREMHQIRWEAREGVSSGPRWLAHSGYGDPVYHGMLYDGAGAWPPYMVRPVDATSMSFRAPTTTILDYMQWGNYTSDDLNEIIQMGTPDGLMDSQIYDMRNDVRMRSDRGTFVLWDGTHVEMEYVHPWMGVQKSPVWETFGVALPKDNALVVDVYATIPIVRPTNLHDTYLSSIPCGYPGADELAMLWGAIVEAYHAGGYDPHLLEFLVNADRDGEIGDNMRLQHIYFASRTYLDYLDGTYLDGDEVHVPVLPNRPYLCTTISPNILESQFMVYGLPFSSSYVSLGGTEGTAVSANLTESSAEYTRTVGVQSPRDGIVSLDVTAGIGAAVSAFGIGDAQSGRTNATGQWLDGVVSVEALLCVREDLCKDPKHFIPLTEFEIDLYDIAEEKYLLDGDNCYGRFVTVPDDSGYVVKTVTVHAALGEHIPVTLRLEAHGQPHTSGGPSTHTGSPIRVYDGGHSPPRNSTDILAVSGPDNVGDLKLTLVVGDDISWKALNMAYGGTDVVLVSPSGTEVIMPGETGTPTIQGTHGNLFTTHVYNGAAFRGEPMQGIWELRMVDHGARDAAFGEYQGITHPHYWHYDFTVNSWTLEITPSGSGLSAAGICDRTDMQSILVQYILRTFVIDVR